MESDAHEDRKAQGKIHIHAIHEDYDTRSRQLARRRRRLGSENGDYGSP